MDYVQPKKIMSPWSGAPCTPKIKERDYGDYVLVEAWWYCPTTGKFIQKGIVEKRDKEEK